MLLIQWSNMIHLRGVSEYNLRKSHMGVAHIFFHGSRHSLLLPYCTVLLLPIVHGAYLCGGNKYSGPSQAEVQETIEAQMNLILLELLKAATKCVYGKCDDVLIFFVR